MARGSRRPGAVAALLLVLVPSTRRGFVGPSAAAGQRGAHWCSRRASTATLERQEEAVRDKAVLAVMDRKLLEFERKYIMDEEAAVAAAGFPVGPEELIKRAKLFLAYDQGVAAPNLLAEDFQFNGPVVGPLRKAQYVAAAGSFDFSSAFPDANPEWHHFRLDPFEPGRVWMTARGKGTNTGESGGSPLFAKPTGLSYVSPPQACSVKFNAEGLVQQYTIGYVMDRSIGNTGGLGGIYGILYAIGKPLPFPEARPWRMSWRYWFFQKLGSLLQRRQGQGPPK